MPNDTPAPPPQIESAIHAAAVSLGRRGGRKGGPARALALSKEERSAIARYAAKIRWSNKSMLERSSISISKEEAFPESERTTFVVF
jgi:hypothetical protein